MADTIQPYNTTLKRLINKEVTYTTLRVMLLNNTAVFDATDTTLEDVAGSANAYELYGSGWTQGGETLASVAVTTVDTSKAMIDATDTRVTATGGSLPPSGAAYKAVVYDDTDADDAPLFFITFGSAQQAGENVDFLIAWHSNGIMRVNWT